MPSGPRAF